MLPTLRLDVSSIRRDFPILVQQVYDRPLVYLDNAATSQKPKAVMDAITRYYASDNANIHRGVHSLSQRATDAYEAARAKVQRFVGAADPREIVFVRGATEGINLVAQTYGKKQVGSGDEVVISGLEHHSNIVPWQMLCAETGGKLRVVPIDDRGELQLEDFEKLLNRRTKIVAVSHVSNALGTVNPMREIIRIAHDRHVPVLVDGAQAAPHMSIDVQRLDCDFYVFSGHKAFGPTGIGVLYAKAALLEEMPPYQGGGDMIQRVTFEKTTWNVPPYKFEAGTPDIAGAIGLGASVDYLEGIGMESIATHEHELLEYGTRALQNIPGVLLIGTAHHKVAVLSFVLEGIHAHDVGTILDREGIAVRTGHHCAQPVMDRFGIPATTRASLAFYNTEEEIDALVSGIYRVKEVFDE